MFELGYGEGGEEIEKADQTTRNTLVMELKGDRGSRRSGMWIRVSIKRERRGRRGVQSGQIQLTVRDKKREERKQKARRKETKRVVVSR